MNHRERVLSALDYKGWDRMPTRLELTPEIGQQLLDHFGITDYQSLHKIIGADITHVEPPYIGPELRTFEDGTWEGIWGERYEHYSFGEGTYPEACYLPYEGIEDVRELDNLRWPSADWHDYSKVREMCKAQRDEGYATTIGDAGTPDFLNGIARCRGVEQVLIDVAEEDEVFLEICERRFQYFYGKLRRTLEAADGMIDIVAFGDDLGTQNGLVLSPASYDEVFAGYYKKCFDLAHEFGARSMQHSCGSAYGLIPRLIELGLDILDVVQVDARNMEIEKLHREFYGKIAFCGSISVQSTLPHGTVDDVVREVKVRQELFKGGGMIIGPTHAIQVGTPIENIIAMYEAIGSLDPNAV